MTTTRARLLVVKELRGLLPLWLATAATMAAAAVYPRSEFLVLGLCAFPLGTVSLGAFSVGQEYSYRTLPVLLAQPIPRYRLLLAKAAALVPLIVLLAILARIVFLRAGRAGMTSADDWLTAAFALVPVMGVCIAPWLTMVFRSVIAGVVFTIAIPSALWLLINVVPAVIRGVDAPYDYSLYLTIFGAGTLAAGAIALVDGPRRFFKLEVTQDAWEIPLSGARRHRALSAAETGRHRNPLVHLVAKELRLQRAAFLLPAFYALAWAALVAARSNFSLGAAFFGMTLIYCGVTAMLVGALASAEERALGTLAVQALQPLAAWKQWLVKVAIVLALTVTFTVLLPSVLEWAHPLSQGEAGWRFFGAFLALMASSLYISSLSTGALQAMLLSMPFAAVAGWLFVVTTSQTSKLIWVPLSRVFRTLSVDWTRPIPLLSTADSDWYIWSMRWLQVAVLCVLVALLTWMAARNHRSAEHGLGRMRR
ncbi:MAG TPA: ABC transporter permease, partial [Gemmatimonadales bacterium]|nr:ABC transporter permease [Gemmatimonadales bacterium]